MALDSIFLSGWEYNRILSASPLAPMVSGLPAPILWSGGAHFWLFKNVYCTTESFDGDYAAYKDLGWSTGFIFADLKRRGFLKTVGVLKDQVQHPRPCHVGIYGLQNKGLALWAGSRTAKPRQNGACP